jgi:DNA-directed RNA polymerase I subunit RPA2
MGSMFRIQLINNNDELTDEEAGLQFIQRYVFVHTSSFSDKFNTMCLMMEKLYSFVEGDCTPDSLDSMANQELLLGGQVYMNLLVEKITDSL